MIQAPIDYEPDPEPDIRRFSSSPQHLQEHELAPDRSSANLHAHQPTDKPIHHGDADTRIERPQPVHHASHATDFHDKSTDYTSGAYVNRTSTGDTIDQEKAAIRQAAANDGTDVPVTRPTSNRPKVRDFAVHNIAQPLRKATEKLVPAKREGPPPDVAFALPPRPRRDGSPDSAAAAQRQRKKLPSPTFKQSFMNTIKTQRILFAIPILIPIAWGLHFSHQSETAIFVASLLAIIPLAGGLSFATEELAHRVGDAWGGLLNATFGNVVELLIAILALVKGDIDIVQASMVGSILSNVLLVLGMSYFAGGLRFHEQLYGVVGAQMHISLLGITLAAIVLPAAYHYAYPGTQAIVDQTRNPYSEVPAGAELDNLLQMSRGLSFMLLAVYGMFLTFQLYTHAYLFRIPRGPPVQHPLPGPKPHHEAVFPRPSWVPSIADTSSTSSTSSRSSSGTAPSRFRKFRTRRWSKSTRGRGRSDSDPDSAMPPAEPSNVDEEANIRGVELPHPHAAPPDLESPNIVHTAGPIEIPDVEEDHWEPTVKVNFIFAMGMLTVMTALAGVTAEFLVSSIDGLTETSGVSREFVGLILLPVVSNACEHWASVIVSVKDKLNLSMSIAIGSSIQISLCILPILVLVGWAVGQPMMLFFDTFETITIVISVLLVNFAIGDGRTNYLEGFILMMAYVMIALVTWFYDPLI